MAHITFNFHSQVLDFHQTVHLLVPDANIYGCLNNGPDKEDIPVLYLLHGLKGAAHTWTSYTSIERYLYESEKKMVVVMPEMHNNFYTDQAIGWPYLKYVAEELPRIIETYLRVSPKRENTYVAGLSMGGYGAMKIALTYPEKFGFAASFSGALDIVKLMQDDQEQIVHEGKNLRGKQSDTEVVLATKEFIFGPHGSIRGSKNDLYYLLDQVVKQGKPLPKLYISCGSADGLFPSAVEMRDRAKALGYQVKFHEERNMGHSWAFWDKEVEKLIRDIIVED